MFDQDVRVARLPPPSSESLCGDLAKSSSGSRSSAASARGFWTKRIVAPIHLQLRQGMTPEKIALTLALGATIATFPVLGSTSILSGLVAIILGLNQPLMQLTGWLFYPLQVLLLLPLYRAGEFLGAPRLALTVPQMVAKFRSSPSQFICDFGGVALGGIGVWCLLAPVAITILYFVTRLPLRALALRGPRRTID